MTRRHPRRTVDPALATSMLAAGHLAVVGASPTAGNFGATIVHELRARDRRVVAVHPSAEPIERVPSYATLAEVPQPIDVAIVMVGAEHAAGVVRECADLAIRRVWLFRGAGAGAATEEAIALAEELGLEVVPGACPLMFLEPVGMIHRIHRAVRRARGSLVAA